MWRLWTDPDHLARWFRPDLEEFGPSLASLDLRPGGAYRIEMVRLEGQIHAIAGTVVSVEEPSRLVLTWGWEGADHQSLVDVTVTDHRGKTTVAIAHTRLTDEEDAARHSEGWAGCLSSLATTVDNSPDITQGK